MMITTPLIKRAGFWIVILSLIFILTNSAPAHGLGVTPSRTTWDFQPNKVYEGYACFLINNIAKLRLETDGAFNDSITIDGLDENREIIIDPNNNCVNYKIKTPAEAKPGVQRTVINAVEVPDETSGSIFAVVKIQHQIDIVVPYPGKYLQISEFSVQNGAAGDLIPISVTIISKGTDVINEAKGSIKIYDNSNNSIGLVSTNIAKNIQPQETRYLKASWNSSLYKSGNYHAALDLTYDGILDSAATTFKLGGLEANIIDYTKEIFIGGIREFSVTADSIWSEAIKNVKAIVKVYNNSNDPSPLITMETVTRDLPPWGTETMKGYLDTSLLSIKNYTMKMELMYEGVTKEYWSNLSVIKEPLPKTPKKKMTLSLTNIMLIALGVLLIIVIIMLVSVFMPKKKKKQE